jgi:hypothetical protein
LNTAEKCELVNVSLKSFSLDHIQTGVAVNWTSATAKTYRGEGNDVYSIMGVHECVTFGPKTPCHITKQVSQQPTNRYSMLDITNPPFKVKSTYVIKCREGVRWKANRDECLWLWLG